MARSEGQRMAVAHTQIPMRAQQSRLVWHDNEPTRIPPLCQAGRPAAARRKKWLRKARERPLPFPFLQTVSHEFYQFFGFEGNTLQKPAGAVLEKHDESKNKYGEDDDAEEEDGQRDHKNPFSCPQASASPRFVNTYGQACQRKRAAKESGPWIFLSINPRHGRRRAGWSLVS